MGWPFAKIERSLEDKISEKPAFLAPVSPQGVGIELVRSETRSKTMQQHAIAHAQVVFTSM